MSARHEPHCKGAPAISVDSKKTSRNLVTINSTVKTFPTAAKVRCILVFSKTWGHTGKCRAIPANLSCYLIQKGLHLVFTGQKDGGCGCGESLNTLLLGVTWGVTFLWKRGEISWGKADHAQHYLKSFKTSVVLLSSSFCLLWLGGSVSGEGGYPQQNWNIFFFSRSN